MTSETGPAQALEHKAAQVARPRAVPRQLRPWVRPVAQLGLVAKAAVYLTIGVLAGKAAIGWGGQTTDSSGAIQEMGRSGGSLTAALVGVGLLCYAAWRFVQAIADADHKGSEWKGLGGRAAQLGSGVVHTLMAFTAFGIAAGARARGSGEVSRMTAQAMAAPVGEVLVAAAGVIVVIVGLVQFGKAYNDKFAKHLDMAHMGRTMREWVLRLGRFGHVARGVTFGLVGYFLLRAALHDDPGEARGIDGVLRFLRSQEHGDVFLGVVAAGVIAYGAFTLLQARYRHVGAGAPGRA